LDLTTLLGIVTSFGLVVIAIASQGNLNVFFNWQSILIVLGGTFGAVLVNYQLKDILKVFKVVKKAFFYSADELIDIVPKIVDFSRISRRDGLLALERYIDDEEDTFLAEGLRMIVDGIDPITIREVLENEIDYLSERHRIGYELFEAMGNYAPAFGMIGTLIGLILMLKSLDSPSKIGPAMSIALVTTFYGALLANVVFLPIAGKLKERSNFEILKKQMIMNGLLTVQQGDIPRVVEQKLVSFLPTKIRERYLREGSL
jgi:chemotaxis protein MotA